MIQEIKKIAIIGYNFNNPNGNIRNALPFIEMCKNHKDIEIHLIMPKYWKDHQKNWQIYNNKNYNSLNINNLKIHKLSVFLSGHEWLYYLKGLTKTLNKIKPNLIFSEDDPFLINTFRACKYSKSKGIPFIFFSWDNLFVNTKGPYKYFENYVIKNCTYSIAGTKDVKKVMIRKGINSKKIIILPQSGIDINLFKPKKNKNIDVLYAGQISEHKGIKTIMRSIDLLDSNIKWVFLGKGPMKKELINFSKKRKNIKIYDWVDYHKMSDFLSLAKMFLYPSIPNKNWEEQYGFAMLEAMSCGVPVIASNTSGPNAIITNFKDGILIDIDNEIELAEKIKFLLDYPKEYNRIRNNALKRSKELSLKNISDKFYKLFKKI